MKLGLVQYALPTWVQRNGLWEFFRLAARLGLQAVEFDPLWLVGASAFDAGNQPRGKIPLPDCSDALLLAREELARLGLQAVVATGGTDPEHLRGMLAAARALEARVVRTVLSRVLCGERQQLADWRQHLEASLQNFRAVISEFEEAAVALSVENHQDLDSDDSLWLCEQIGSDFFGLTLDTGNPLAVGEDILEYARRVSFFVKDLHLKDYRVYATANGFTLFRCALGEGVVDLPALLKLFRGRNLCAGLELGAPQARPIRILDADWQRQFPRRAVEDFSRVAEWARTRAVAVSSDISTPGERGAAPEAVAAYELAQVEASARYLLGLTPP